MLKDFSIDIISDDQMVATRKMLQALGYTIFETFIEDDHADGWKVISMQGEGEVARSYWRNTNGNAYRSLEDFLIAHFESKKSPERIELETLQAQVRVINKRIAELKEVV